MYLKKYRILVLSIMTIAIIIIFTSNPIINLNKGTGLIGNIIKQSEQSNNEKESKDSKVNDNSTKEKENDSQKEILICIDPGHQEKGDRRPEQVAPGSGQTKARVSSGATGVSTKKPEYILNLEASMVLKHILEGKGYNIVMTRESHNVNISNAERAQLANDKNAKMVIRIHADSISNPSKTGASILIPAKDGKYTTSIYEESSKCANLVQEKMKNDGININGIFERNDLTGFNWSKVPVILIEMGFLSNHSEDQMMSNPEYQRKLMQSVADGVEEYFLTN